MINNELRDYIAEEHQESVVFNVPSYDNAIVGISEEGRIIYNFDLMVAELMFDMHITAEEATEYINYNTLRTLPYMDASVRPIILFDTENIKEIKDNYDPDKT